MTVACFRDPYDIQLLPSLIPTLILPRLPFPQGLQKSAKAKPEPEAAANSLQLLPFILARHPEAQPRKFPLRHPQIQLELGPKMGKMSPRGRGKNGLLPPAVT